MINLVFVIPLESKAIFYIASDIVQSTISRKQPDQHNNSSKDKKKTKQSATSKIELKSDLADLTHHSRI